ncbi:MAG: 3-hydroxybenzoate 6-monooxygenase [Aliishimia sp.]
MILIAGGGIGGLAAALGLAQKDIPCTVFEKSETLGEIGAGIQLGPNAFHAFDALGVGREARELAVYVDDMRLMDALSGDEIARIPVGDAFHARFGNPYAVVHRGELHGVLLRACVAHPLIALRTGAAADRYDLTKDGVSLTLQSGESVEGRALIGADGLWSSLRAQMVGDAVRVSGHSTYRSVIAADQMPQALRLNSATLWAGPKCHIVHYPLSGGTSYNLVVTYHNDAPSPVVGLPVDHEEVRRGFTHVAPALRELIDRGQNWRLWVLCDRDPVMTWTDGPVALLGDAAHPMMQYMAQGACMALEDAVCLAGELHKGMQNIANILVRYQERRRLRTARVQLQSREMGTHVYHPEGAHAALRNSVMGAKTETEWYDTISWLYGSTGLEGTAI